DLQQILVSVFEKILVSLGSDRAVFFGGSGGGFASMFFASHFQNSLALVFNPQTNIAKYSERAVREFATKAFQAECTGGNELSQLPSDVVVDVCELYRVASGTRIAYLQNANDESHLQSHLLPFTQAIHPDTEFLLFKEPWQDGHSPPPKELLSQLLNLSVSSSDWTRDFTNAGFTMTRSAQSSI